MSRKKQIADTWPKSVVLKNDTPVRVRESVTRTVLMPYSECRVLVANELAMSQIEKNFKSLNALNNWENGLTAALSLGE